MERETDSAEWMKESSDKLTKVFSTRESYFTSLNQQTLPPNSDHCINQIFASYESKNPKVYLMKF